MAVRQRVEVRLDDRRRQQLGELARARRQSVSDVVRGLIDRAHDELLRRRRLSAAERLASYEIEDVPDPDELSRQLDETYEPPDLR